MKTASIRSVNYRLLRSKPEAKQYYSYTRKQSFLVRLDDIHLKRT